MKEFNLTKTDLLSSNQSIHKFDHVQQNKQLSSKIVQYQKNIVEFKKSVLSKSNGRNIQMLRVSIDSRESKERVEVAKRAIRWDEFRQRRAKVVDKYI